ncbi:hypothetical protein ABZX30_14495 [Streptomyces sp. NPDC004542]|uniref:hypothetical protein n=1 Tax=Streptomyces sp. NPDC004542 TaxID=3154281 RepID=UPI0033AAB46F
MFLPVLAKSVDLLDRRFLQGLLMPSLVFWAGIFALVTGELGWAEVGGWWNALDTLRRVLFGLGAALGLVFFAVLLAGCVPTLTRLLEGYWPQWLSARGVRRQLRRWGRLDPFDPGDFMRRHREFPYSAEKFMPTRFGNVLRAAETYPGDEERYGADAVFYWPRLYLVMPEESRSEVRDARTALDQAVVISALSALFAIVAVVGTAFTRNTALWFGGAALLAAGLSHLAYRVAVGAAAVFGDLVRSCFDVHRHELLASMGFSRPVSLVEERALWLAVSQQLYRRLADRPELLRFDAAAEGRDPGARREPEPGGDA